ncbi:NAD(P)H-binding protein [Streptomyces cinnabarinus]|uniref:NAD(P)H-binding protein n=1 Tax=Streptomyces cinnabarinus TaxID=67287 RepID=A0ABY7KVC3_9ACTN|nr:NAD(P)H-binding protein [Streptomyces cinnabarinus]WAZ26931.1 NAD(P)H-binding protein [Streptomyces cinnabarinus]
MTVSESSILVFGATGSLGRHVLNAMLDRGTAPESVTAVGRNRLRLGELASAGFNTVAVDLSDAAGVADVVARHTDVVLISGSDPNRLAQHRSVIEAARSADVRHVHQPRSSRR